MREKILLVVGTLLLCLAFSANSAAQDAGESGQLEELVNEARTAFGEEDYETAIDSLLAAYRIEPNARLLYNTARSYEELDDCRRALVYYRAFTQHEDAEEKLTQRSKKKLARSDRCDSYSPSLSGRLTVDSTPAAATIIVDGEEMGQTPSEIAGLPSGEHTIAVKLDGYETASNTVQLEAGKDRKVSVTLAEQAVADTDSSDLMGEPGGGSDVGVGEDVDTETSGAGISIPAVALVGAGVVGLGVGAYIDLVAIPNTDDERSQFAPDSQDYRELTDKRQGQVTTALVGYIGGGALLAAGATWLVLDLTGTTSGSARIQPVTSPSANGFVGGLRVDF